MPTPSRMRSRRLARRGASLRWLRSLRSLWLAAAIAMLALPAPAAAQPAAVRALDVTFDLVLLRPLGAASTVVGTALFVPAALVASPGGRDPIVEAWDRFVLRSAKYTATRPLGEF